MVEYKCPLCNKSVKADIFEGSLVMFDPDDTYHNCWFNEHKACCKCREERGEHMLHGGPHWLCNDHGGPKHVIKLEDA